MATEADNFFTPIKSKFTGKAFAGHAGRPGQIGGSRPRGGGGGGNISSRSLVGTSAAEFVRSGGIAPKKLPVGTELELNDKRILSVDRSNGYVISGVIKGSNQFTSLDLRRDDAKIKYIPSQQTTMNI